MRLLRPFSLRDFRLLWIGTATSMLGDGIYFVAVAFQAYALDNDPGALALVGLSWTGGMVLFLLAGGVVADRQPRRRVMMGADVVRALVLAAMGVLSLTGELELWMLASLAALYGAGEAFFGPAFSALVPELVPEEMLMQANSVEHGLRPLASQVAGPALGGGVVALLGPGGGFLLDAATFACSFACLALLRTRERPAIREAAAGAFAELRDGLAYVRAHTWLWATLAMASISLLVFFGPEEVLVPYVIKNEFGGSASDFGLVLAVAGLGNALGSVTMGRRDLPRRPVTVMYLFWGIGILPLAGYALATASWHLMPLAFAIGFAMSSGLVIWSTLMQVRVPPGLRGRVNSLDWFVSIGLTPVSFALTAPVSAAIGIDATFVAAGGFGCAAALLTLWLLPGLRERGEVGGEARIGDGGGLHAGHLDALAAGEPGDGAEHREAMIAPGLDRPAP